MAKETVIFNNTKDEQGNFQTGFIVSRGTKYVTINYLTNVQGYKDKTYKLPIVAWDEMCGTTHEKCLYIHFQHID